MSKKATHQFLCSKMMLPEHCAGLREHVTARQRAENNRRPELDEQFREEMQQLLEQALATRQAVEVTVLESCGCRFFSGVLLRSDPGAGLIYLDTGSSRRPRSIKAGEVIRIEPV